MTKTALVTGITGQDGTYLAELLLDRGYVIYGIVRRLSTQNIARIEHIADRLNGTRRGLLVSYQTFQERMIDKVMRDFHEHKLLAHPIAAGIVELCHADSLRGGWLSDETMADIYLS